MSTEFYADYIKKTTFDPDTSSVRQKFTAIKADDVEVEISVEEEEQLQEAATDVKKKPASKTPKLEVPATEIPVKEQSKKKLDKFHTKLDDLVHDTLGHSSDEKKVKEELHGDQHKLDHNKDKKITASDMKMVRKHGPVKEEDDLSELDASTMKNYMKKAKKQAVSISQKPNVNKDDMRKFGNRVKGISMAQKKLGEDQELEEGTFKVDVEGLPTMYIDGSAGEIKAQLRKKFKDPKAVVSVERITPAEKKKELRAKVAEDQAAIDAYLKKGGTIKKLPAAHARSTSDMEKDVKGRVDTSRFKTKGKVKSMEDVEHVDEISNAMKGRYTRVAARDIGYQTSKAASAMMKNDREGVRAADRQREKRYQGIDKATKSMQKEGAMKRIATQDAEKERLGPKVKGSGLDTFKKKPMDEEKDTHVTKDGRTAKKGLWYNIHKKRARGEAPAKPGDPDRPSAADLKRSQN